MKIFLCYGYRPHTTAVYFEKALMKNHEVYYVGPPWGDRPGYSSNEDLNFLVEQGFFPKPDLVLFIEPAINFFPRGLEKISCPTACYLIDVNSDLWVREYYAPFFDYLFVGDHEAVTHFKRLGYSNVYRLPLACDSEIHGRQNLEKVYDVGFVGNPKNSSRRQKLLKLLASRYKMNDFERFYAKEEIALVYSQSKIVFNCGINGNISMRVYEAFASGSMLLTDPLTRSNDFFTANEHYAEYTDEKTLLEKTDYYLNHEAERERIAQAGRHLVLSKHTYVHRCQFLLDTVFSKCFPEKSAKIRNMSQGRIRMQYAKVYAMLKMVDPALEEFNMAWERKTGIWGTVVSVLKAFARRLNAILNFTSLLRKLLYLRGAND